jgi:hypothetical protein
MPALSFIRNVTYMKTIENLKTFSATDKCGCNLERLLSRKGAKDAKEIENLDLDNQIKKLNALILFGVLGEIGSKCLSKNNGFDFIRFYPPLSVAKLI